MDKRCQDCGKTREGGWLLIDGRCLDCDPEAFERRRAELLRQARKIVRDYAA